MRTWLSVWDGINEHPPTPRRMLFGGVEVLGGDRRRLAALGRVNLETH